MELSGAGHDLAVEMLFKFLAGLSCPGLKAAGWLENCLIFKVMAGLGV